MDVTDKIALVTGGGRGIGRGIATVLARNGADVAVTDLNLDDALSVAAEVSKMGRESMAQRVDVTVQESVESMVEAVLGRFGRIDILVNNAGIVAAPGWEERARWSEEDWDLVYAVNVRGVARVTEAVAPHMTARRYGKIVNIASGAGRQGQADGGPYSASKASVINMTQTWAAELAEYNVNVNSICPGLLWTPMWQRIATRLGIIGEDERGLPPREVFDQQVATRVPLKREQTPEDIGSATAFLASDYAKNITGQALNLNGGIHMN
jgi:NAD(P)-dependent dehydrogenase (short-subunit alcohol dehydrogenase family)